MKICGRVIQNGSDPHELISDRFLIHFNTESGVIQSMEPFTPTERSTLDIHIDLVLGDQQFIVPGWIDTHTHAPQATNCGLGQDLGLLEWLREYTFPAEQKFKSLEWAQLVYPAAVSRNLRNGTTMACYYGTVHLPATVELVRCCRELGQRALVGKVNMDQNSDASLQETTRQSLDDTRQFIKIVQDGDFPLQRPVITPRFAPTCSLELMTQLGQMAAELNVPVQTHLAETINECKWVSELFPQYNTYTDVYDGCGLLKNSIMAHGIHLTDAELALMVSRHAGIAHCPNSNFSLQSGICDVQRLWRHNVVVGLGTDVSGGHEPSMLNAMRLAIIAAKTIAIQKISPPQEQKTSESSLNQNNNTPQVFGTAEALWLATRGGAELLQMDKHIGQLRPGMQFDALVIDMPNPMHVQSLAEHRRDITHAELHLMQNIDTYKEDTWRQRFDRFIYMGDDRNIKQVYVNGKLVKSIN